MYAYNGFQHNSLSKQSRGNHTTVCHQPSWHIQSRAQKNFPKHKEQRTGGARHSCCPRGMCWEDAGGVQILQMKMLPLPAPGVEGSTPFPACFRTKERECATTAYCQENTRGLKTSTHALKLKKDFKSFKSLLTAFKEGTFSQTATEKIA